MQIEFLNRNFSWLAEKFPSTTVIIAKECEVKKATLHSPNVL